MPTEQKRSSDHGTDRHAHGATKISSSQSRQKRTNSSTGNKQVSSQSSRTKIKGAKQKPEPEDELKPEGVVEEQEPVKEEEEEIITENGNNVNGNAQREPEVENEITKEETNEENLFPESIQNADEDKFSMKSFSDNIMEFTEIFDSDKFKTVDQDYPVDDLIDAVSTISKTIEKFKEETLSSQTQLEGLREKMRLVKENIHLSISKNASGFPGDDEVQTIEERELQEKLQRLNAEVAKANADLSDALRLSAETERTAITAQLAAEKAKEEAKRIEEEIELKSRVEAKRKVEEEKKMEEMKKRREEEEKQAAEIRKAKEAEWKRKEASGQDKAPIWEKWPTCEFTINSDAHDLGVGCIVRGNPSSFDQSKLSLEVVDQEDSKLSYKTQEELVSCILRFEPQTEDKTLQEPIFVAIPFVLSRTSLMAREPFVKGQTSEGWEELPSKEVAFDNHKDVKFLQAEIRKETTMAVMTRFKQDYVTLSRRPVKITSSFDQRVTITVPKDTFRKKELFRMQVQPIDSATVHELQQRKSECKGLLTCSPMVQTEWESKDFINPVTITIPCPLNPAKARRLAQIRKMKEEKMKKPQRILPPPVEVKDEKEEKKKKLQQQQQQLMQQQSAEESKSPTRWYMGDYAHNDDDENDSIYLLSRSSTGKWTAHPEIKLQQVRLDLVQFELPHPMERFMVIRTRTNVEEDAAPPMSTCIFEFLAMRFAQVLVKQRSDDPFDVLVTVVPVAKTSKVLKSLNDSGYDEGPEASNIVTVNEGDVIEISFRGNIKNSKDQALKILYNSNVKSEVKFYASEVDQYLQKNFNVFRGLVQVSRCYSYKPDKRQRKPTITEDMDVCYLMETKKDLLCEISLSIPKYHIEAANVPNTAPVTIITTSDPVDVELMRDLARDMGDEWKRIAQALNVSRARIQAIIRNVQMGDRTDEDIRYEMLMSWLKKMPKATDKVAALSSALIKGGRVDLAEDVREKGRDFRTSRVAGRS